MFGLVPTEWTLRVAEKKKKEMKKKKRKKKRRRRGDNDGPFHARMCSGRVCHVVPTLALPQLMDPTTYACETSGIQILQEIAGESPCCDTFRLCLTHGGGQPKLYVDRSIYLLLFKVTRWAAEVTPMSSFGCAGVARRVP